MPFPTDVLLTSGTKLLIQRSIGNSTLPTITATTSAAVTINATSIPITALVSPPLLNLAAGAVLIQEGSKLTFNSTPTATTVTVTADVIAGATNIAVLPVTAALQSGNTSTSNGLLQLLGVDNTGFTVTDKKVSSRSFENGIFDSNVKVSIGGTIPISGLLRVGDPAFNQVLLPSSIGLGEMYVKLIHSNRNFRAGFCFCGSYKEDMKIDDLLRFSMELMMNGAFVFGTDPV